MERHVDYATTTQPLEVPWGREIPDEQWTVYRKVIREACGREIPYALGGAFGLATYSGRWRDSKDMDIHVLPRDHEQLIEAITQLGLTDYYDRLPYDRSWIYRSCQENTIVDVIWRMANHRTDVDEGWLDRAKEIVVRGEILRITPPEEMIWSKLYVVQRERCDWPDILNILYATADELDWEYLVKRVGGDVELLAIVVSLFAWVSPGRALALPGWLWRRLDLRRPAVDAPCIDTKRMKLLDSRPWFGPPDKNPGSTH